MAAELEQIPLSADLQHWHYCPRQCGLIHLEQVFDEIAHTPRGQEVHATVDQPCVQIAKGVRVERALPLWHDELGVVGKADVVEFSAGGVTYPLKGKHGSRDKAADIAACDAIQRAAQTIRQMFAAARLPPPLGSDQAAKRCKACALLGRCQPVAVRANLSVARAALFDPDA